MSKGSKARPYSVSYEEFDANFNRIFRQVKTDEILEDVAVEDTDSAQTKSKETQQILSETPQ